MNKRHLGSSFDDFLRKEKLFESVEAGAIKRVIAFKLEKERTRLKLGKADMAKRMKTSRAGPASRSRQLVGHNCDPRARGVCGWPTHKV